MTHDPLVGGLRYEAVLKPLEFEQRMRIDYRNDVLRIVAALAAANIVITEEIAFAAWRRFSEDDRCATWYSPGSDDEIRRNLMPHLEFRPVAEQAGSAAVCDPPDKPDHATR